MAVPASLHIRALLGRGAKQNICKQVLSCRSHDLMAHLCMHAGHICTVVQFLALMTALTTSKEAANPLG